MTLESKRISARRIRDYARAWAAFVSFCVLGQLQLPDTLEQEPRVLSENLGKYIEHLYAQHASFTKAKYAILSVQHRFRHLRRQLQTAWDKLSTWELELPLNMRRPIPVILVWAVFANAMIHGLSLPGNLGLDWLRFGVAWLCGYYGMMRPGEIFSTKGDMFLFPSMSSSRYRMLIAVRRAKNQRFMGKSQIVVIENGTCVRWCRWLWEQIPKSSFLIRGGQAKFTRLMRASFDTLNVPRNFLGAAGLRAGRATELFLDGVELTRLRVMGRWKSFSSLDHYVQQASSLLVENELGAQQLASMRSLLRDSSFLRSPPSASFAQLWSLDRP